MTDLDAILAPIPGDAACGIDLRKPKAEALSSALNKAMVARRIAQQEPGQSPDWETVQQECVNLLCGKSKDTEVAAFLTEALVNADGFQGLSDGGRIIAGLLEHFWDGLYPSADPSGEADAAEARLRPVRQLIKSSERLMPAIRRITLFVLDGKSPLTFEACKASQAAVEKQCRDNPTGEVARSAGTIAAARDAWQAVSAAMSARLGVEVEDCRPIITACNEVLRFVRELLPTGSTLSDAVSPGAEGFPVPAFDPGLSQGRAPKAAEPAWTRDGALRQLSEIAAFFRKTEPFSPVSYTLEEVVRRAELSWPDWLSETVTNPTERDAILLRLGLPPEKPRT